MTTLFNDSEVFQKERPTFLPNAYFKKFCGDLAQELIDTKLCLFSKDRIRNDLEDLDFNDGGYGMAKELEQQGWNITTILVEYLDGFSSAYSDEKDKMVKEWVKAYNIKPTFKEKQRIVLTEHVSRFPSGTTLYINGIMYETAKYIVDINQKFKCGIVIPFEKLESKCELITSE